MAAPSIAHVWVSALFSSVSSVEVAFTSPVSAGGTVVTGATQNQATRRSVSSWTDDSAQTYTAIGSGVSQSGAHVEAMRYKESTVALASGDTVNLAFNANSIGRMWVIVFSASTYASLTDTYNNGVNGTSHKMATTGFATSADVAMIGYGSTNGGNTSITPGDGYTEQSAGDPRNPTLTLLSNAALGTQTAPYTTGTSRGAAGMLAAFYAAGGGGRTTKNTRSWPLGVNVGMGWRMPV